MAWLRLWNNTHVLIANVFNTLKNRKCGNLHYTLLSDSQELLLKSLRGGTRQTQYHIVGVHYSHECMSAVHAPSLSRAEDLLQPILLKLQFGEDKVRCRQR